MLFNARLNLTNGHSWYKFGKINFVGLVLFFIYIPWLFIVCLSFFSPSRKGNLIADFSSPWTTQNYSDFFINPSVFENFWEGFFNSLFIASIVIPVSLFIGLMTSVSIWMNNGRFKRSIFFFSNISIAAPDIIQGISFLSLFLACFLPLGINLGFFTIILSHIAISVPFVIVFIYPKLTKISKNVMLSSYDLKYSHRETIINILLPMLMPNIIAAIVLIFSLSFDDFLITHLVRGNVLTITSEMYKMKKGIKMWAITFGALVFWLSMAMVLLKCFFHMFKDKK